MDGKNVLNGQTN